MFHRASSSLADRGHLYRIGPSYTPNLLQHDLLVTVGLKGWNLYLAWTPKYMNSTYFGLFGAPAQISSANTCMHACVHACIHASMHTCTFLVYHNLYIYIHICVYVYIMCMYVCIYTRRFLCRGDICIYIYVCMYYVYTHMHKINKLNK